MTVPVHRLAALGRSAAALLAAATVVAAVPAAAFEQSLQGPDMVVSVPRLPQVAVSPSAATAGRGPAWRGDGQGFVVDILATPAAVGGSTRVCAGTFLRDLVRQPGMPDRDSIYRAPIDADTFLVLYIQGEAPAQRLHGHLLAAVADTHCVDAHFSRPMRPGEEVDDWRTSFEGAAVRAARR